MTEAEERFWDTATSLKDPKNRLLAEEIIAKLQEDFRTILAEQEQTRLGDDPGYESWLKEQEHERKGV